MKKQNEVKDEETKLFITPNEEIEEDEEKEN